jgi:hypothetical protein
MGERGVMTATVDMLRGSGPCYVGRFGGRRLLPARLSAAAEGAEKGDASEQAGSRLGNRADGED